MQMPFGKHRGKQIDDIPADYLSWCLNNLDDLSIHLRQEMMASLNYRLKNKLSGAKSTHEETDREAVLSLVNKVHKEMALRFHPDRGGSSEAMIAVGAFVERLRALVEDL